MIKSVAPYTYHTHCSLSEGFFFFCHNQIIVALKKVADGIRFIL